jgi:integrase
VAQQAQKAIDKEKERLAMAIFKRGGVYWFNFWWDGQHIQRSTKQGNPRVARQIESAFRTALAKGEVGITKRKTAPSFSAAMQEFLSWSEQQHKAHPRTHRRYMISSRALLLFFKDVRVDQITVADVEKFKIQRAGQKGKRTKRVIRPATVNRELACLKAVFNFLIKGDLVVRNPVSKLKFLEEDNEQVRVVSYDEQRRYLAAAPPTLADVAVLMLETGMRPDEVYRIRAENVHLAQRPAGAVAEKLAHPKQTALSTETAGTAAGFVFNPYGKTKAAKRKINLTAEAARVLRDRMKEATGAYLFPHHRNPDQPVPKVNNAHSRALKSSSVAPFRLYDLRHTFATRAAMAGVDLVTLAAILGHARIQMVLRYAHPTQEHQANAMIRVETFNAAKQMAEYDRASAGAVQ